MAGNKAKRGLPKRTGKASRKAQTAVYFGHDNQWRHKLLRLRRRLTRRAKFVLRHDGDLEEDGLLRKYRADFQRVLERSPAAVRIASREGRL